MHMEYSERLPTRLKPLAERTCFSQERDGGPRAARGQDRPAPGLCAFWAPGGLCIADCLGVLLWAMWFLDLLASGTEAHFCLCSLFK
jgi:hypothetical protein